MPSMAKVDVAQPLILLAATPGIKRATASRKMGASNGRNVVRLPP